MSILKSSLYIVATPIGNLSDITYRALEILKQADIIACEDTRVTKKLLNHYDIKKSLVSFHHHSPEKRFAEILKLLKDGKIVALVSDAGTPGISDPGGRLVEYAVKELSDQAFIIPIPGPAAFVSALSVSGFPTDEFLFLGFPPHKKGRQTFFKRVAETEPTVVFYESKHRIIKTLNELIVNIGDRPIIVCRELTKQFETIYRGTAKICLEKLQADKILGEFAIVVRAK